MAKEKSLTQKTLGGFFWLAGSSGLKAVLQLVVVGILARLLSPSDFGVVAAAMVVILFTEMLYEMGVGPALVQLKELTPAHEQTAFTFSIGLGVFLAGFFYFLNPYIAAFYEMPRLTEVLNVLVWLFPLKTFSQISYSLLQRDMRFKRLAGLDVLSYFIGYGLIGVGGALAGYGIWALVWANLGESIIFSLLLYWVKPVDLHPFIDRTALKALLNFGGGFTLAGLLNFGARKIDYILVGKYLGGASLGIYSRAYSLMNAPNNVIGKVMNKVLFSSLSKIQDDPNRIAQALAKSYSLLFLFVLPISGVSYLMAEEIVLILLGDKWLATVLPFQILVISMVFRLGYKLGGVYLRSLGKTYILAFTQGIYFLIVALGSFYGLKIGIEGVAAGVAIAIFINFFLLSAWMVHDSALTSKELLMRFVESLFPSVITMTLVFFSKQLGQQFTTNAFLLSSITLILTAVAISILLWLRPSLYFGKNGYQLFSNLLQQQNIKAKLPFAKKT